MSRADLAKKLIAADGADERRALLANARGSADEGLAEELRKQSFAAWTSEPVTAQRAANALRDLAKFARDESVTAIAFWVAGIADITKGKFEAAAANLDKAGAILLSLGRDADAAQIGVSKLLALAMLGRYDDALATGMAALKVFVKHGDDLAAGKIEMNLSNIVSRRALHSEAEKYCLSARRRFIRAGELTWQAMAENGLANTYAELNDFKRASQFYEKARSTAMSAGMLVTDAEIEASMGNLALFRGRYADALRHLELSRRKFETLGMPHQTAIAELEIADIYAELNLNAEAVEIYERVGNAFRRLKLRAEEARTRLNFGRAARKAGSPVSARKQAARASKLFSAEKNVSGQAAAMLEQAHIALDCGDNVAALAVAKNAGFLVRSSQNLRLALVAGLLRGEAYRRVGDLEHARLAFENVLADAIRLRQPDAEQSSLTSLARVALARGDSRAAEAGFKRAIRIVEVLRAPLASEEFSIAFVAARLEPYDGLARLYLDAGRITEAFRVIENGRARSLADALSDPVRSGTAPDGLSMALDRVREELNSYYKRLERADDEEIGELQAAVRDRESRVAGLTRQIASAAAGRSGEPTTSGAAATKKLFAQLGDSRTLIEFVEFDGVYSAFVAAGGRIRFVRSLATAEEIGRGLEDLHFQFGALRYGTAGMERYLPEMKSRTDACLRRLYDGLLRPLESYIRGDKLVIVPAGSLYYVPFHALHDGGRYVVEKFETTYAPSAGVWNKLQERPPRQIRNSLLMGFADERIPLVENEIGELRGIVPGARALAGPQASFAAFVREAPKSDLIHLACHGQFRAENPMFSSLHLADGWVTVRDICSQRVKAELVTLSACETGLNKVCAGDEILGLARGFLTAGASSLIVSLWTVNDAAAVRLMKELYSGMQRGTSVAASLRQAQIRSIELGEHPFMWSPFILIGR